MITGLIILGCLFYAAVAIWTMGYVAAWDCKDCEDDPLYDPFTVMGGLVWPLVLPFIFFRNPFKKLSDLGVRFRLAQMKRIEDQEIKMDNIRVELQIAEKEVEQLLRQEECDDLKALRYD